MKRREFSALFGMTVLAPLAASAKGKKGKRGGKGGGGGRVNKGPTGDGAERVSGQIDSVDPKRRVIVVNGSEFSVPASCNIDPAISPRKMLSGIEAGTPVSIRVSHGLGGRKVATSIDPKSAHDDKNKKK